jgi:Ca2+-binding EF-hand superfamily protein
MVQANEIDAWDDVEFDAAFKEFDYDGNGEVSEKELVNLVKRFAAL